jgi:hypothetical protein
MQILLLPLNITLGKVNNLATFIFKNGQIQQMHEMLKPDSSHPEHL